MKLNRETETICTTLGDLVEAVASSAFQVSENPREAYLLSAVVLDEILKKNRLCRTCRIDCGDILQLLSGMGLIAFEGVRGRAPPFLN